MIEVLLFAVALAGTAAGGWIDLKTTEIPDIIPASMAVAGLILHIANAYLLGSMFPIYAAFAAAIGYLTFGYILYYTGQWGEADVLLLGAIGFLLPVAPFFFNASAAGTIWYAYPLIFLLNTFIVGGVYSIIYAFIVAFREKHVIKSLYSDIHANAKSFAKITLVFLAGAAVVSSYISNYIVPLPAHFFMERALMLLPAIILLFLVYRFAIVVDKTAFRKKVLSGKLQEGDVLAESISAKGLKMDGKLFIGLTEDQIKKIQKAKKTVWIKEGIRYGPTFFLALVATWLYGNILLIAMI